MNQTIFKPLSVLASFALMAQLTTGCAAIKENLLKTDWGKKQLLAGFFNPHDYKGDKRWEVTEVKEEVKALYEVEQGTQKKELTSRELAMSGHNFGDAVPFYYARIGDPAEFMPQLEFIHELCTGDFQGVQEYDFWALKPLYHGTMKDMKEKGLPTPKIYCHVAENRDALYKNYLAVTSKDSILHWVNRWEKQGDDDKNLAIDEYKMFLSDRLLKGRLALGEPGLMKQMEAYEQKVDDAVVNETFQRALEVRKGFVAKIKNRKLPNHKKGDSKISTQISSDGAQFGKVVKVLFDTKDWDIVKDGQVIKARQLTGWSLIKDAEIEDNLCVLYPWSYRQDYMGGGKFNNAGDIFYSSTGMYVNTGDNMVQLRSCN